MFGFDTRLLIERSILPQNVELCPFLKEMDDEEKEIQIRECNPEKAMDESRFDDSKANQGFFIFTGTLSLVGYLANCIVGSIVTAKKDWGYKMYPFFFITGLALAILLMGSLVAMYPKKAVKNLENFKFTLINAPKPARLEYKIQKIIERLKRGNVSPDEKIQLRKARNVLQLNQRRFQDLRV